MLYDRAVLTLLLWLTTWVLIATLTENSPGFARATGGALLVLVLPGVTLTRALAGPREIEGVQRALFALGGSIAATVLCGLGLNLSPAGITTQRMIHSLAALSLAGCVLALLREQPRPARLRLPTAGAVQIAMLAPAAVITVLAIEVARHSAVKIQRSSAFTQLYALPRSEPDELLVGVRSFEPQTTSYRLELRSGGRTVRVWLLTMAQGAERQMVVRLTPDASRRVRAILVRLDRPGVTYRSVHITLP